MDANRVLNATINGAASAAAVYLIGRASGYRYPRIAALAVGGAVGFGSYDAMADVDFEAIEADAKAAAEAATEPRSVPIAGVDDEAVPSARPPRREAITSAVEHAMGFGEPEDHRG